jgi:2'-5' RNA ligase
VARLRGGDRRRAHPATQAPLPATPARTFTPAEIVLYRSWLSPAGASYEALASRTLTPA